MVPLVYSHVQIFRQIAILSIYSQKLMTFLLSETQKRLACLVEAHSVIIYQVPPFKILDKCIYHQPIRWKLHLRQARTDRICGQLVVQVKEHCHLKLLQSQLSRNM